MSELLRVDDLKVHFSQRGFSGRKRVIRAVDGVSLSIDTNEALGIIGESGCGKSTTGRAIVHLEDPTEGRISYRGADVTHPDAAARRAFNEKVQFVFQDPMSSLNPRMTVESIIAEPLRAFGAWDRVTGPARVVELLERVGLPAQFASRYPHEFSGGQRQRIGIARALALDPELLVLDEPVSALDVSVQAQVLNLLMDLRRQQGLAYIMISHDLDVIRHVTDRIAVMYLGVVVETGPADEVLDHPLHPYTAALVSATPPSSPDEHRERIRLQGELPSASNPPSGCRFRTRCWRATEVCAEVVPPLEPVGDGRSRACHHPLDLGMPTIRTESAA
ncbi:ATP-binding cassette domain-containing protein [Pseudolysinimonas kribbensis]|uniref:Dipeptide/oligopeptide/nickel ABC transporter ATP-binding protein n=1 Tax=Pseudolysinimonas kribbensis TaxID=433641 RepID=A0ABQ6K712_9MICO|nr:oligopeptide/dipeptide ABC transporter ATP-binding protein [Pseudolysinimonas kribbensis]GMA94765.1 dipeptide/oligopeptide/nickel ABC transporter ATP-binding protein [Pseudolysinimonas kribbensis]